MLFPDTRAPAACMREIAALTGGEPPPDLGVALTYLTVPPITEAQLAALRTLTSPVVPIHADSLHSVTEKPHPLFGYTLAMHVAPDPAFDWWRAAVRAILVPGGDPPQPFRAHLHVVRHMAIPPSAALARLRGRDWSLAFTATTLIVSQRVGNGFARRVEHRFAPD
jgi:hypothetical protein